MLFSRQKRTPSACPKTGKSIENKSRFHWLIWLFPITGLLALIWFLIRVIPKPSRATYPCQRLAFPLASGFIVWLLGLAGSVAAYRKAKRSLAQARYIVAVFFITVSVGFIWMALSSTDLKIAFGADDPNPANDPIGVAKGIHPGRVAWIHDANATDWSGGHPPYWWSDNCIDQTVVDEMLSKALRALTGENTDAAAWDAIFRNFNQQMGRGDVGYTTGEKIAIKTNWVLSNSTDTMEKKEQYWDDIDNSPQLAIALLKQLTDIAGVDPCDICLGDPSRVMANYWYNMVAPNCPNVVYLTKDGYAGSGRTTVTYDYNAPFYWSDPCEDHWVDVDVNDFIPTHFSQSTYFIDFPILKSHNSAGITVSGKNHFGSLIRSPADDGYYDMHHTRAEERPGMGHYRAIVDLLGHPKLGGKTMLCLVDGLYAGRSWDSQPIQWQMAPFNNDWPSSIFLSQDPIATDSVCYDFMFTEWDGFGVNGYPHLSGAHDYLHEAALISSSPSGTTYDPNNDGGLNESLGVHEHWNNAIDKQYSRNLDPNNGTGIELITETGLIGDFDDDDDVNFEDFAVIAASWSSEPGDGNWNVDCDISMPSDNIIDEYDLMVFCENWLI